LKPFRLWIRILEDEIANLADSGGTDTTVTKTDPIVNPPIFVRLYVLYFFLLILLKGSQSLSNIRTNGKAVSLKPLSMFQRDH
jgi:hypothetical protein